MTINIVEVHYDEQRNELLEETLKLAFSVKEANYFIEHCYLPLYYYINDAELEDGFIETWNNLAINERNKIKTN